MHQDENLPLVRCGMSMATRFALHSANNRVCDKIITSERRPTPRKDVWSTSRIAFVISRNFELFRLSAITSKTRYLDQTPFTSGLINLADRNVQDVAGRQLTFCVLSEPSWQTQVELLEGAVTNVTISEDAALLFYVLGTPRVLVWHNDDRPLELNFTTSHDIITNRTQELRDWNFV